MMPDPAQRDLGWYGYSPRALLPLVGGLAVLSWTVWLGRWYVEGLLDLADRRGALTVFALAWAIWPLFLLLFCYRTVTYTYRLTDRAVLLDFGFMHNYQPPIPLEDIKEVRIRQGRVGRWLNVGDVEIHTAVGRWVLPGVYAPAVVVAAICQAQQQRRAAAGGAVCSETSPAA